jgi:outer membrane biosynthesis protein TonB
MPHAMSRSVNENDTLRVLPAAPIQVMVERGGEPYLDKTLSQSPAIIGRDETADICLNAANVSRRHAEIHFGGDVIRLTDSGSKNGFKVNGRPCKDAVIGPDDRVTITDFNMRIVWRAHGEKELERKPLERELAEGWAEFVEENERSEKGTIVRIAAPARHRPTTSFGSTKPVPAQAVPTTTPTPARRPASPAAGAAVAKDEEEDEAEPTANLLLFDKLKDESNSLLYGQIEADYAVEVLTVLGRAVVDVALLRQGRAFFWGHRRHFVFSGWGASMPARFSMVDHCERGKVQVRIPVDPRWKIFHRGKVAMDSQRVGDFLTCVGAFGDQIQVTCNQLTFLTRWVRLPLPPARLPGQAWFRMSRALRAALIWSMALHAVMASLPMGRTSSMQLGTVMAEQWASWSAPRPRAVGTVVEFVAQPSKPLTQPKTPAPPLTSVNKTKKEPDRAPPRSKPPPINLAAISPDEPPAAASPPRPSPVSVADFKVLGMIAHLPDVQIPETEGFRVGSGAAMLRPGTVGAGGRVAETGFVGKNMQGLRITGTGKISALEVSRVINRHANEVGRCYQDALAEDPGIEGQIEIEWIVDRRGTSGSIRILQDGVGSTTLVRCLQQIIPSWSFPWPEGGLVYITTPLRFGRLNR